MFEVLYVAIVKLIQFIQPALGPICFVTAWGLVAITVWSLWTALRDGVAQAQRLHRIPCANCQFFTGDYHLKCTVHPTLALTESAIDCSDYQTDKTHALNVVATGQK